MCEAMGSAEKSHPQEIKSFIQELQDMGVRLKRPKEESLAYEPNVVSGKPGTVLEIDLANSIGRKDIAKRLEELRDDEIKKYIY